MFRDKIRIKFKAGKGGDGLVSFGPYEKAWGGQGGDGGNVYLVGDRNQFDLSKLLPSETYAGENGEGGGVNNRTGSNGADIKVKLPLGSVIYDMEGNKVGEILNDGEEVLLLKGGIGGMGNYYYKHHSRPGAGDEKAKKGQPGEELEARIELELISDIIFLGLPNAGKSSLLSTLTGADAAIGAYAFTTLVPQLGRMNGIVLMDLPGLIEGAHAGKGLGTEFERHTRRARLIAHCVAADSADPVGDYKLIRKEIAAINLDLAKKPEVVILTKIDEVDEKALQKLVKEMKKLNKDVLTVSTLDDQSIETLKKSLSGL
jgi:GTPase